MRFFLCHLILLAYYIEFVVSFYGLLILKKRTGGDKITNISINFNINIDLTSIIKEIIIVLVYTYIIPKV